MSNDKEELVEIVSRITPEDAVSVEALMSASVHAVAEFEKHLPEMRAAASKSSHKSWLAREAGLFMRSVRNDWLRENGAYRYE